MGNARSDKHISRQNSKSAYTPALKKKSKDTKQQIVLFCILTPLLIINIISLCLIKKYFEFWVCLYIFCMAINLLIFPILKEYFTPYLKRFNSWATSNQCLEKPKKIKSGLLKIVYGELVVFCILNLANSAIAAIDVSKIGDLKYKFNEYNFSIVLSEEFNIYFDKEDDAKSFANTLETCFTAVEKISSIPSKETLESPNDYGDNAKKADNHERDFHSMWENNKDHIRECPLALDYCDVIIELREKMDGAFETPENRRQLVDVYFRKGKLTGDKVCYEWAVRYAFASFYTELTWGNYSEYYIDKIIEMYQHLDGAENEHEDNIETIIDALTRLKDVFKRNPPGNVISVLDRYK